MALIRKGAFGLLWLLAALGVLCGSVWVATTAGLIQPLVVVSGSMEPGIQRGDLLIATRHPVDTLKVGDVVTVPNEVTGDLVTHRVQRITPVQGDNRTMVLKGDANEYADGADYSVSGSVWSPEVRLPGAGTFFLRLSTPVVAIPLGAGLLALLAVVWLPDLAANPPGRAELPTRRARARARRGRAD